jgi:hypothetical protein
LLGVLIFNAANILKNISKWVINISLSGQTHYKKIIDLIT